MTEDEKVFILATLDKIMEATMSTRNHLKLALQAEPGEKASYHINEALKLL